MGSCNETNGNDSSSEERLRVGGVLPESPDPFWPSGVRPLHLSADLLNNPELVATFTEITGPIWRCEKCASLVKQSMVDKRYCTSCVAINSQNSAIAKKTNGNWMEEAAELGIALFERQPEETDEEWRIWCTYRNFYPRKLPTFGELAKTCGSSVATVMRIAGRWSFKVRLSSWARYTDEGVQEKRIDAIKEMNERQLSMAKEIQQKLELAIKQIVPETLRPGEIVSLFKVATELERRVTDYVPEKVESETTAKGSKGTLTKAEDLNEVVAILQRTGLLEGKTLGVEQTTTTTRMIAREDV